jgi:histidinol dehydrogenase
MIKIFDISFEEATKKLAQGTARETEDISNSVASIIANVKKNGSRAVMEYSNMFDKTTFANEEELIVKETEISEAYNLVSPEFITLISKAATNIHDFHSKQVENSWFTSEKDGVFLGQLIRPIETVGIYVPGVTAALASSVLMSAIPAEVAGVKEIIMCTPPRPDGTITPEILVAAHEVGVSVIYKIGGAQAIAAMAYGTEAVQKVDKICGPGNIYVTTAKRMVYGACDIDMIAGPSEIAIVADDTANAAFVAADMLSQAEHDILSSAVLFTNSELLAKQVAGELDKQIISLSRQDIAEQSIDKWGAIYVTADVEEAIELANVMAPEHLEICTEDPFSKLSLIRNAGAIFLGNYSSEPLGDYFAGPNHILPTGGAARFFSPLGVRDFLKRSSVISYSEDALAKEKDDIYAFAMLEGLDAHANAIKIRFENIE